MHLKDRDRQIITTREISHYALMDSGEKAARNLGYKSDLSTSSKILSDQL
jgi:hypothetical protein